MKNISYQTEQISRFFSTNRIKWDQFYPSEKVIFKKLDLNKNESILDIGCACGGLGLALKEKFSIDDYTGIDINTAAIDIGKSLNPQAKFLAGDILDISEKSLKNNQYDLVCSMSCIDWNVQFNDMLAVAWNHVKPGGNFIATFRITEGKGNINLNESYQYINFDGKNEGEIAAYIVVNFKDLLSDLEIFEPKAIKAYGYWGTPSPTAVTPHSRVCFTAISVEKRLDKDTDPTSYELDMPSELINTLDRINL